MALYALGDMHLAFSVDKPMDRFGKVWKKHEEKIAKNCGEVIQREDTLVITGDHSWGRKLSEAEKNPAAGKSRYVLGCQENVVSESGVCVPALLSAE